MPARIVVVHDDREFARSLVRHLDPGVAWFDDPTQALALLKAARTVEFLITRLAFGNGQSVGLSLARVTRAVRPGLRVIFTGSPDHRDSARGLGEFLSEPISAREVGMIVEWLRGLNGGTDRNQDDAGAGLAVGGGAKEAAPNRGAG